MSQLTSAHNPFMLLLQPEVVLQAIERSEKLNGLNRHQCRPLDRPQIAGKAEDGTSAADASIDGEPDGDDTTAIAAS